MSRVIVLYATSTGPVVGVLRPVGAVPLPALPSGRTFRLPVGTEATYVQFRSDQLAAATVETSETDPLALFGYGVRARPQVAAGPPEFELVQLTANAIVVDPVVEGATITGRVNVGNVPGTVTVELWNAGGQVRAIQVPGGGNAPTPFEFPKVESGQYVVLVPGCLPHPFPVPAGENA